MNIESQESSAPTGAQTLPIDMPKTPTILIGSGDISSETSELLHLVNPQSLGNTTAASCLQEKGLTVNSASANLKRAPSETTVSFSPEDVQWERSQSEANLSLLKSEVQAAISSLGGCIDEEVITSAAPGANSRPKFIDDSVDETLRSLFLHNSKTRFPNLLTLAISLLERSFVSEQARVYWNLPEAVDEEHSGSGVVNGVSSGASAVGNTMSSLPSAGGVSMSSLTSSGLEVSGSCGGTNGLGLYIAARGSISSEPTHGTSAAHFLLAMDHPQHITEDNEVVTRGRLPSGQLACTLGTIPQQEELEIAHLLATATETELPTLGNVEEVDAAVLHPVSSVAARSMDCLMSTSGGCENNGVPASLLSSRPERRSFNVLTPGIMSGDTTDEAEGDVGTSSSTNLSAPGTTPISMPTPARLVLQNFSPPSSSPLHPNSFLNGWSGMELNSSQQQHIDHSHFHHHYLPFQGETPPLTEVPSLMPTSSGSVLATFAEQVKNVMWYKKQLLLFANHGLIASLGEEGKHQVISEAEITASLKGVESCIEQLNSAWQLPQHGRELAIAMCSCIREEGLLEVLARLSAGVRRLSEDECRSVETTEKAIEAPNLHVHLLCQSTHLLSQVLTKVNCTVLLQMSYELSISIPASSVASPLSFMDSSNASIRHTPTVMNVLPQQQQQQQQSSLLVELVKCAWIVRKCPAWSRGFVAILSGVLKQHSSTCDLVLQHDGLRVLTYACRTLDMPTLRHTTLALTNLALYARGAHVVEQMARGGVAHWLYPAANRHEDPVARYYACMCIAVLWTLATTPGSCLMTRGVHILSTTQNASVGGATNTSAVETAQAREEKARLLASSWSAGGWCGTGTQAAQLLAQEVQQAGTLNLVWPFIRENTPNDFAHYDSLYFLSRSKGWLQRLLPVLACEREEVQALAAFHFALEARVKVNQRRASLFQEIGALPLLFEVAGSAHYLAAQFAAEALHCLGENAPPRLCPEVALWREGDVLEWLHRVGFSQYATAFQEARVDGDALLRLDEDMLRDDLGLRNGILRQRFLRELIRLKCGCSYSSVDSTGLSQWLRVYLGPHFVQYTYPLLCAGVDRLSLPQLLACSSDGVLMQDCGIRNGLHRAKFIQLLNDCVFPNSQRVLEQSLSRHVDIFISHRRNSAASHLASLLKVHLQLRGYSVTMDVEGSLCAGQFPSTTMHNIHKCTYFLLVLTANAFEACQHDEACHDSIHQEIVCALRSKCKIIPILEQFLWPSEHTLPSDMRDIVHYPGVQWIYENQDVSIDEIQTRMLSAVTTHQTMNGLGNIGDTEGNRRSLSGGLFHGSTMSAMQPSLHEEHMHVQHQHYLQEIGSASFRPSTVAHLPHPS